MKTILVPVERHDLLQSVLETALALGKTFDSYIQGLCLSPAISPFLAADAIGATVVYDAGVNRDFEAAEELRRTFEDFMQARDVPPAAGRSEGPSFAWMDEVVDDNFVGSHARTFDITVVGRPGARAGGPRVSTLEAALFESGRPILIAPPTGSAQLGDTVMIAWNRSTETARAIAFAMPLLKRARRIVVLTVEGGSAAGPDSDQVRRYLERHGVVAEVLSVEAGTRTTGEAILAEAEKISCDLLIKGAYTQSRLRQLIFGGSTRHIIAETTLPVFMAH